MRKNSVRFVKRSFRRVSERKLTTKDLLVLDFLWNWKAASTAMLKEVAYKNESSWWVYKALRRLKDERYIQLLPRGRNLDLELWALTKNGFEVVLMDRDDLEQYRYRVHAPAHDYLATCLQLGDLWQSNADARFFTEQQLSSLASWNFPSSLKSVEGHIPDGVTMIRGALHTVTIGYEVDLNLKEPARYERTAEYYRDGLKPNLVVWLVRNVWIAEKIFGILVQRAWERDSKSVSKQHVFCLLDDFKKSAWGAKVLGGTLQGTSIRKLHANLIQTAGKTNARLSQKEMAEIFFPKFKSPQKSMALMRSANFEKASTPFGSKGELQSVSTSNSAPARTLEPTKQGEHIEVENEKGITNE